MENSKEIMMDALALKKAQRVPCAPHWWGIYKYEVQGLDYRKAAWQDGSALSSVYEGFYELFNPDWFHLHIGTPKYFQGADIVRRGEKDFLAVDPGFRNLKKEDRYLSVNSLEDEEIVDFPDYLLGSRARKPKADLGSKQKISDYVKRCVHMDAGLIAELGYTDHVRKIAERYGNDVFIAVHIPSAVCEIFDPTTGHLGFEQGLIAFHEYPAGMRSLFEQCYESQLEWAKAYARAGAHAFIISESYISPDIAGPEAYRQFLKSIHRDYFGEVERMGLIPICNFWGDINPIVDDLTEINCRALMFEEGKKTFQIDVPAIRERIGSRVCLFGNLNSLILLHDGHPDEIREEVLRQGYGAGAGFIMANGSPIAPGTPERNVKTMIEVAKEELKAQ